MNLINLTVDLFIYDLRQSLGDSDENIQERKLRFWQRIYHESLNPAKIAELEPPGTTKFHLLGSKKVEKFNYPDRGYYYPVKMGDSYGLRINCLGKENNTEWEKQPQKQRLQDIKKIIRESTHQLWGELGESWLIWGQLPSASCPPEQVAANCYEESEFFPGANWKKDLQGKGTFGSAHLFEITSTEKNKQNTSHLLLCLLPPHYSEEQQQATIQELYKHLMRLWCYRHKIIWNYEQSQKLKQKLIQENHKLESMVENVSAAIGTPALNLQLLQQCLQETLCLGFKYRSQLGYLEESLLSLETNEENYQQRLKKLTDWDNEADLKFLQEFPPEKYLKQVKKDINFLKLGEQTFQQLQQTMDGAIALEKTRNDRAFNQIAVISPVAIACASITAILINNQTVSILSNLPNPWLILIVRLAISIAIGIVGGKIAHLLLHGEK